ncbi:hypothetical protein TIFTF001_053633 [Ficus carica]|uniref:Uncharacterized protein n=1 Tax=Ficus carica TaxID=3494 RepID=A0AA88JGD6_FICCA|nr:hypothetical protein TIFTF001_053633 [Ficus carica]
MEDVCVFVKYNGQWDGTLRYVGGEMKEILVPETATYVGLIELIKSAISIRGPTNTIVMRYGVEPRLPLVRIQCDADVKFYIQLKKKDVHSHQINDCWYSSKCGHFHNDRLVNIVVTKIEMQKITIELGHNGVASVVVAQSTASPALNSSSSCQPGPRDSSPDTQPQLSLHVRAIQARA